jgi:hypothetical protein
MKCSGNNTKHGHGGHAWKGHGPDRKCTSCGLQIEHASESYPQGIERYRESTKKWHETPRATRRAYARNVQDDLKWKVAEMLEKMKKISINTQ